MAKTITMDQATTDAIAKAPRSWVIAQRDGWRIVRVAHVIVAEY